MGRTGMNNKERAIADAVFELGSLENETRFRPYALLTGLAVVLARATSVEAAGVMAIDGPATGPGARIAIEGPWTEHEHHAFLEQSQWDLDDRVLAKRLAWSPGPVFKRTEELMPIVEFKKSRLFNEFQRPRGLGDQATMLVRVTAESHLIAVISRVDSDEPLSSDSVFIAQRLAPYISRCWESAQTAGPRWARKLSPRRRCVLELVSQGLDDHQIAESMGVRYHTVRAHLKDLFRTAQVRSRLHLIQALRGDEPASGSADASEPAVESFA